LTDSLHYFTNNWH